MNRNAVTLLQYIIHSKWNLNIYIPFKWNKLDYCVTIKHDLKYILFETKMSELMRGVSSQYIFCTKMHKVRQATQQLLPPREPLSTNHSPTCKYSTITGLIVFTNQEYVPTTNSPEYLHSSTNLSNTCN